MGEHSAQWLRAVVRYHPRLLLLASPLLGRGVLGGHPQGQGRRRENADPPTHRVNGHEIESLFYTSLLLLTLLLV